MTFSIATIGRRIGEAILRSWVVWAVTFFAVTAFSALAFQENPLKNDDSFCLGLLMAIPAGITAFILYWSDGPNAWRWMVYLIPIALVLGVWTYLAPLALPGSDPEGRGMAIQLGALVAGGVVMAYPLARLPLNWLSTSLASLLGIVCMASFVIVRMRVIR